MDRWRNKVAVVTGASSGIGAAIAIDLVKNGMIVVALARRKHRLDEMKQAISSDLRSQFHGVQCDVCSEEQVMKTFEWIDSNLGGIHVLINNAGVVKTTELIQPDNTELIRQTIDTNIMGVVFCTRETFKSMQNHKIDDGHIVLINSIVGHSTPNFGNTIPSFNIYPPTKYAVTSMTEVYRQEFLRHNTKIRITSVSPGAVDTEVFPEDIVDMVKEKIPMLKSEDVSNAVLYALSTPAHVQIHEITIKPIGEQF